jgi:hypothetical protein
MHTKFILKLKDTSDHLNAPSPVTHGLGDLTCSRDCQEFVATIKYSSVASIGSPEFKPR